MGLVRPQSCPSAIDPIADIARFGSNVAMTTVFHGSYVICALLGLLQLFMFGEAYLRGEIGIYHPVLIFTSGATSTLLLASIFFPLKAKLVALFLFAVCTISTYIWSMSSWSIDPTGMSFSEGIIQGVLLMIFAFVPVMGMVSGALVLRRHPTTKSTVRRRPVEQLNDRFPPSFRRRMQRTARPLAAA